MRTWESTSAVEHAIVYCLTGAVISVPFVAGIAVSSGRISVLLAVLWAFVLLALLFDQINDLVTTQLRQYDETGTASDAD